LSFPSKQCNANSAARCGFNDIGAMSQVFLLHALVSIETFARLLEENSHTACLPNAGFETYAFLSLAIIIVLGSLGSGQFSESCHWRKRREGQFRPAQ